jgi:dTDP-4-dehydrorhamnose reductase
VLGAGGQLGQALRQAAPSGHSVIARTRAELDIADSAAVQRETAREKPDWILNAAAYTAVDLAEEEPAKAASINDQAVGTIAQAAAAGSSRLVHLSTDFVFDGASNHPYRPDEAPRPLSAYGASKRAGELKALGAGCEAIVLRTAWVYASTGRNFALTMLKLMREREQVRVVGDQIGTPTWAWGLACAVWALVESSAPGGIYHWTDLGVASWYDFAVAIQDEALERGLLPRAASIVPITTGEYPTRARRPAFSVLDTAATRARVAMPALHWRHNLRMMLDELRAR